MEIPYLAIDRITGKLDEIGRIGLGKWLVTTFTFFHRGSAMGIVRTSPELENRLDDHATSWLLLTDRAYKTLVKQWSAIFRPLIEADRAVSEGDRAIESLQSRLPGDVFLFNGFQISRLANMGGVQTLAYRAVGLKGLDREQANQLELIVVPVDLSWCCIFSHEVGTFAREQLYEQDLRN